MTDRISAKNHPFEKTLGPGPYRFLYVVTIHKGERGTVVANSDGTERGIGTCCHCGQGIMNCYVLLCGDGQKRAVGSDCIARANLPYEVKSAVKRAELDALAAKRAAKKLEKHEAAKARGLALVAEHSALLATIPHFRGRTFLDYTNWCLKHSTNCVYILKAIEWQLADKAASNLSGDVKGATHE